MTESSRLREAAEAGDIAAVSQLVDAGADPNAADDGGLAPLHAAAGAALRWKLTGTAG